MTPIRTIYTYAKINLILQVEPPIENGYHPIGSWMHSIDLADTISIELIPDKDSTFDIRWSDGSTVDWDIENDLVFRSHAIFEHHLGRKVPVRIQVRKHIPAGGGLGGGSSNAAGVLMLLNEMMDAGLSESELQSMAHKLGTDIPYFIDLESFNKHVPSSPAIVSGLGIVSSEQRGLSPI